MKKKLITICFISLLFSCESEEAQKLRLESKRKERIQDEQRLAKEEKEEAIRLHKEKIENEILLEKERKEQEIYEFYINNSLTTGATPYSENYGGNSFCENQDCSEIIIKTSNSDVLVTIKSKDKVVRHAYIQAGDSFTFSLPNGYYQPFFYYGKGWNPEKEMKGGEIKGGFVSGEDFGKDDPQNLYNTALTYKLILQENGNFSTSPSNPHEAL